MTDALPSNLQGDRDRALLVIGFAGGFRRSELAALDVEDVAETGDGLVLALRRSKTDQEGQGAKVALPFGSHPKTCPGPFLPGVDRGLRDYGFIWGVYRVAGLRRWSIQKSGAVAPR